MPDQGRVAGIALIDHSYEFEPPWAAQAGVVVGSTRTITDFETGVRLPSA